MNQPNPIAHLTNQATKDALLARQAHMLDAQHAKVAALEEQVDDRLRALSNTVNRVRDHAENYPYGAFGSDTATIDDLLKALARETEALRDMQAAGRATEDLSEKYERLMAEHEQQAAEPGRVIPMGAGQYL